MNMITRTAIANMKYYKGKNVLTGIVIFLASFLLLVVPMIGRGIIDTQYAVINKNYPTWHAMYRGITEEQKAQLSAHHDISFYGLRSDAGYLFLEPAAVEMLYMDERAMELCKLVLKEGRMPEAADEIVLSQGIMQELGVSAEPGETVSIPYQIRRNGGLDKKQERTFTLVGLLPDSGENVERRSYTALVSKAFLQEEQGADRIVYSFLFQTAGGENVTTDDIEAAIREIAGQFDISENAIQINTTFLSANYVDPGMFLGIVIIMVIIVLAAVITIYSIYYVAMAQRIQEFGRLKAIGTTRKQLRQLVLKEGLAVCGMVMPVSLLAGSLLVKWILRLFVNAVGDYDVREVINNGEIQLYHGWIYVLAAVVTLVTVYLSLLLPMRKAARVSEIEAMRYQGDLGAARRAGKGYTFMNTRRLTKTYLTGNKKKSMITILSMSITGVFLLVIGTVLSCANAEQAANFDMLGQYEISLNEESGNQEHPEREKSALMQNNPLTEEFVEKIRALDGVDHVDVFSSVTIFSDIFETDTISGAPEEYARIIEKGVTEGSVTYEELKTGDKAVLDSMTLHHHPELKVGDILHLQVQDGDDFVEKDIEIAAIGNYNLGFTQYCVLIMAKEAVDSMVDNNAQDILHIFGEERCNAALTDALGNIISESDVSGLLSMRSWQDVYEKWKKSLAVLSNACYIFLGILSAICIMNLINTMMNSVYVRKKELGMLQAIGMSNRQLTAMLWREGMFYTFGTLIISVGLGSLLGYPVYLWMVDMWVLNVQEYHYPWTLAAVVIVVMVVLQCILAVMLSRFVQRDSLIERIRFSG